MIESSDAFKDIRAAVNDLEEHVRLAEQHTANAVATDIARIQTARLRERKAILHRLRTQTKAEVIEWLQESDPTQPPSG